MEIFLFLYNLILNLLTGNFNTMHIKEDYEQSEESRGFIKIADFVVLT